MTQTLNEIHQTQQAHMQRAEERRQRKGKGQGKHQQPQPTGKGPSNSSSSVAVHQYLGNNTQCSICRENFYHNELVYRVNCNHVFHQECWDELILRDPDNAECPNCRGPGIAKALYKYVGSASPYEVREAARRATTMFQQQHDSSSAYSDARSGTIRMAT